MATVDSTMKRLRAARKKLTDSQGRVARTNARKAFLVALRAARKAVDDEYPNIPKKRRKPRKAKPTRGKERIPQQAHRQLLAAGVKPRHFFERAEAGEMKHAIYAPTWMARAWYAKIKPKTIAAAVRSKTVRRRVTTIVRLGGKTQR